MRKYAFINNNIVVSIKDLSEIEYIEEVKKYQLGLDVTEELILPQIGYILEGNKLVAFSSNISEAELLKLKMQGRLIFGNKLCQECIIKISARNLELQKTSLEVLNLMSMLSPVQACLQSCALPTAVNLLNQLKPNLLDYEEILNFSIDSINNYLEKELILYA